MRYIIETKDEQGIIGMQIDKWRKEKKLDIIEKADPVVEIKIHLEKVARAIEVLRKAGYNSEVMQIYLNKKTGVSLGTIRALLKSQLDFFNAIGIKLK